MIKNWDTYGRQGIDLASTATSFGFNAVKAGTKLGFAITRGIATTTVGITTTFVDHAIFGGSTVTRPFVGGAISTAFSFAERITLAPIFLSEYVTSTSLIAAHSSINVLSVIFPGSSDASFSLASFITLVRREWTGSSAGENLPEKQYGITRVARAIVAWVSLQGVTQEWQEKAWLEHLKEIHVGEVTPNTGQSRSRRNSRVRVTSDVIFPGNKAQIIAADIGEARPADVHTTIRARSRNQHNMSPLTPIQPRTSMVEPLPLSNAELKTTLRRLSKMVLAGYGGASLLFFGVGYRGSASSDVSSEETQLAKAIDASEAEAAGDFSNSKEIPTNSNQYSWWDVLLGKHDQEIFERAAGLGPPSQQAQEEIRARVNATAVIGSEHMMPRFWVLTDHGRRQVVLVLRGTMSLNEIAADLTCEPEDFEPATTIISEDDINPVPGQFTFPSISSTRSSASSITSPRYHVHGGMLRLARAMGDIGKPVQLAVQEALHNNPNYDLVMCGHSLGAGVAAILGMKWADPRTCLTVRSSGLPIGRRVSVYCFAPPAVTDAALGRLADRLIVSFVYSHDIVSRLSLGSVRDLKNAALWLCEAEESGKVGEGWAAVTTRAKRWKAGAGSPDDPAWFIAVRKTLEANMQMSNMFPPGRVLWAMRDSDLHPSHRSHPSETSSRAQESDKLRLFEVLDVERVFPQIVFARDMLTAHMPHQYDKVLHDLL